MCIFISGAFSSTRPQLLTAKSLRCNSSISFLSLVFVRIFSVFKFSFCVVNANANTAQFVTAADFWSYLHGEEYTRLQWVRLCMNGFYDRHSACSHEDCWADGSQLSSWRCFAKIRRKVNWPFSTDYTSLLTSSTEAVRCWRWYLANACRTSFAAPLMNLQTLSPLALLCFLLCISCSRRPSSENRHAPQSAYCQWIGTGF